nr:hypothetical protein [Pseudomonas agarici]
MIEQNFGCCCHPAVTPTSAVSLKSAEALNYVVSQGRFERPTFPLGGAKFPVFKKVRLKRGYISALVNCLVLARAFGQPLAMQGSVPPQRLNPMK